MIASDLRRAVGLALAFFARRRGVPGCKPGELPMPSPRKQRLARILHRKRRAGERVRSVGRGGSIIMGRHIIAACGALGHRGYYYSGGADSESVAAAHASAVGGAGRHHHYSRVPEAGRGVPTGTGTAGAPAPGPPGPLERPGRARRRAVPADRRRDQERQCDWCGRATARPARAPRTMSSCCVPRVPSVNLSPHLNHQVEVVGRMAPPAAAGGGQPPARPARASRP